MKYSGNHHKKNNETFHKKTFRRSETPLKSRIKSPPTKYDDTTAERHPVRLNKFIANAGICSRREADELILSGSVSVNGKVVTQLGIRVMPTDKVKFNDQLIKSEKPVYVLLNKPKGFITTTKDPEDRRTVMEIVKGACKERIYPVGRLDRNTTGLLLLTNDGELAEKLAHPSYNIRKIYEVGLDQPVKSADIITIRQGMELEDGFIKADDIAIVSPDKQKVGIEIHSGRNRIIRRIFEKLGYEVTSLDRVMYANLTKKDLPRGKWRMLSPKEILQLKHHKQAR
jgi:23S rRNA pseudouridine2605 synthase